MEQNLGSIKHENGFNIKDRRIGKMSEYAVGMVSILPAVILVIVIFLIPFFSSFLVSFKKEGHYSLENYKTIFHLYGYDILYTIFISAISLVLVIFISVFAGGYLRIRTNRVVEFFFKVPLFVPFVVVGHAMRVFLAPKGILNMLLAHIGIVDLNHPPSYATGVVGIVIALTWKNVAMALLLTMGAFRSVDESFLEAARNFGASTFKQIKDILLPLSFSAIAISSILIFTSMLQSFSIPVMMGSGEGPQMIMIDVYHRITYLNDLGTANALGVVAYILAFGTAYYYIKKVVRKDVKQ